MSIYINNAKWTASDATSPSSILAQPTIALVAGNTYKVYIKTTGTVFAASDTYAVITLGGAGGTSYQLTGDQTWDVNKPIYLECGTSPASGVEVVAVNGTAGDTMTIDNISVIVEQFTLSTELGSVFVTNTQTVNAGADIGPIDEFVANGTYNSQTKYTSTNTHPDGAGGAAQAWDLWWDGSTDWIISPAAGTKGSNHWKLTAASAIGTFTAVGDVIGAGEVTYGPTDHSTATGSPGMKTDGIAGYIDLKTSYDYLNGLRAGKFGIVSVFEPSIRAVSGKILSTRTTVNSSYYIQARTTADKARLVWGGTGPYDSLEQTLSDNNVHTVQSVFDIANTNAWTHFDGSLMSTDTDVSGLFSAQSTFIRLGARADDGSLELTKAKFAFTAILDLSSVTTVDEDWSTGLSAAINTAAENSGYNAAEIAIAIHQYDPDIVGYYWALNEINNGDASDYYLIARAIGTNIEQVADFYGLVSASGVNGTRLVNNGAVNLLQGLLS